jgi:hypothetical protein
MTGRAIKGTWGTLGRQTENEITSLEWIASDESELVLTTDVNMSLPLQVE